MILLDTHVVLWLFAGEVQRFPSGVKRLMDESELAISPIVELELAYLHEIGRVTETAPTIVGDLSARIGLTVDQIPFGRVCAEASSLSWTRDTFDRLQSAHAITRGIPLVTKDRKILEHLSWATWPQDQ